MITALYIALSFLLVFANGFFVASEFEFVGVRRSRIEMLAQQGSNKAKRLLRLLETYVPMLLRARRSGSLGMRISPLNGWSSSTIRKMAPEIENAETSKVVIAVVLRGASTLKLRKITTSQVVRTTSNGREM